MQERASVADIPLMDIGLTPAEDDELRRLVALGMQTALTPREQRRIAELRRRDRRDEVRLPEDSLPLVRKQVDPVDAPYELARRIAALLCASGGEQELRTLTADEATPTRLAAIVPSQWRSTVDDLFDALYERTAS